MVSHHGDIQANGRIIHIEGNWRSPSGGKLKTGVWF